MAKAKRWGTKGKELGSKAVTTVKGWFGFETKTSQERLMEIIQEILLQIQEELLERLLE